MLIHSVMSRDIRLIEWCAETGIIHRVVTDSHSMQFYPTIHNDYLIKITPFGTSSMTIISHFGSIDPHFWLAPEYCATIVNERAVCDFHPPTIQWEKVMLVSQVYRCQYCKVWYPVNFSYSNPQSICKHFAAVWNNGQSKVIRTPLK